MSARCLSALLGLVVVLNVACDGPAPHDTPPEPAEPPEPEYQLADPNCKDYLAEPGKPCSDGHWLNVDTPFRGYMPRATLCSCYMIEKGSKK